MNLSSSGLLEHLHQSPLGVAANDGVVHHNQPFSCNHLSEGIELEPDTQLANGLGGLNKGSTDIGVFYESVAKGDAALLAKTNCGRGSRFWRWHHKVCLNRELLGQCSTHLNPRLIDNPAVNGSVGAG